MDTISYDGFFGYGNVVIFRLKGKKVGDRKVPRGKFPKIIYTGSPRLALTEFIVGD